jgi:type IV fimbrial biogenesis protein FimT
MLAENGGGMLSDRKTRGFTLVEMMVVMAILGIFLAIAVPSFRQMLMNFQIRALSESILNGLQLARSSAVQRNEQVQFELATSAGAYTLGWTVKTVSDGTVIQSRSAGESSSVLIIDTVPALALSTTVTFDGMGRVLAPAPPAPTSLNTINVDVPTSVMPAADSRDLRIRVLSGGLIKMCNPNIVDATDVTYCP